MIDWMLPSRLVNHWRRGWGEYPMQCKACGHKFVAVARVGTKCEIDCSACEHVEKMNWLDGSGETIGNDGVWL